MAGLQIQIGADNSELNKKIKEAEFNLKELANVKIDRIKLGLDTKEIDGNIKDVKKSLTDLKTTLKDTGNSFGAMQPKVASGGNALMQFSRIAQDAPYGIIGIGNNITATVESFGHLRNATGSTGSALKAMGASILGSGGILLGVSLLTTGLTYLAQNGITVKDVFEKLTGTYNEFSNSIRVATEESVKNAQGEISAVNAYAAAAKNINLSMKDRLIAVQKLQDEYPNYFGNLSQEQILNGGVAGSVKEVTAALMAKAKAAAYSSEVSKLSVEEVKLRQEEIKQSEKTKKALDNVNILLKDKKRLASEAGAEIGNNYVNENNKLKQIQEQLRKNKEEQSKWTNEINKSYQESLGLANINKPKAQKPTTVPKAPKAPKGEKVDFKQGFIPGGIVNPNLGLVTPDLGVDEAAIIANEKLKSALELQKKTIADFNAELGSIVTNGTVNALAGIGESIGNAMASGGNVIDAVGKTILSSMGAMLQELGKATIAYGVGLIAVKTAIKNPYLAVAAGVTMVALGSAMSASISKSAASNPVTSGGSVQAGNSVSSPTSSVGSSSGGGSFSGGTVVFEISGQSLIGVLSNTLDKNKRLGGSITI